jgi:hypothetical protein
MWICSPWKNSQENWEKLKAILAVPLKTVKQKPSATSGQTIDERNPRF